MLCIHVDNTYLSRAVKLEHVEDLVCLVLSERVDANRVGLPHVERKAEPLDSLHKC